jgi:hypothetical protein
VGGIPEVQVDGSVELRPWLPTVKKLASQPSHGSGTSKSSGNAGYQGYQVIGDAAPVQAEEY